MAGLRMMQSLIGGAAFVDRGHERFYAVRVRCGKKEDRIAKVGRLVDAQRSLVLSSRIDGIQIGANGTLDRLMKNLEELQAEVASLNAKAGKKKKKKKKNKGGSSSSSSECSDVKRTYMVTALPSFEEPAGITTTREIYRRGPIELKERAVDASPPPSPVSIEVCTVGKCRRGGSQEILAALEGCDVEVTSCKCMGKCKSAPNVRVRTGDGESQVRSYVSVDDVDALLGVERKPMFGIAAA